MKDSNNLILDSKSWSHEWLQAVVEGERGKHRNPDRQAQKGIRRTLPLDPATPTPNVGAPPSGQVEFGFAIRPDRRSKSINSHNWYFLLPIRLLCMNCWIIVTNVPWRAAGWWLASKPLRNGTTNLRKISTEHVLDNGSDVATFAILLLEEGWSIPAETFGNSVAQKPERPKYYTRGLGSSELSLITRWALSQQLIARVRPMNLWIFGHPTPHHLKFFGLSDILSIIQFQDECSSIFSRSEQSLFGELFRDVHLFQ